MISFAVRIVLVILLLSTASCGPINASTKIAEAKVQVIKAASVGAPKYAPFEYQGALLYLEKAREEEGYAYYQDAVLLAKKAFELALASQNLTRDRIREEELENQKKETEGLGDRAEGGRR